MATEPEEIQTVSDLVPEHAVPFNQYEIPIEVLQQKMTEYKLGTQNEKKYLLFNNLLYSHVTPSKKDIYPRLVLPIKYRLNVIAIAHTEVGYISVAKTILRLQEHFRWPGMTKDIFTFY